MLFEKILYFCRKKAASQQSEQAPLRSICTIFGFQVLIYDYFLKLPCLYLLFYL